MLPAWRARRSHDESSLHRLVKSAPSQLRWAPAFANELWRRLQASEDLLLLLDRPTDRLVDRSRTTDTGTPRPSPPLTTRVPSSLSSQFRLSLARMTRPCRARSTHKHESEQSPRCQTSSLSPTLAAINVTPCLCTTLFPDSSPTAADQPVSTRRPHALPSIGRPPPATYVQHGPHCPVNLHTRIRPLGVPPFCGPVQGTCCSPCCFLVETCAQKEATRVCTFSCCEHGEDVTRPSARVPDLGLPSQTTACTGAYWSKRGIGNSSIVMSWLQCVLALHHLAQISSPIHANSSTCNLMRSNRGSIGHFAIILEEMKRKPSAWREGVASPSRRRHLRDVYDHRRIMYTM
ncbi:hypothetical protein EV126DRAFT_116325 [Verticillium dahliae]|nr:hypothetical protein EV126DRAFT_116325 [Verticillium dahliae]